MGWADNWIERLRAGEKVQFRPRGNSMTPRVKSGQLCTVTPVVIDELTKGDVVLCKVGGSQYLHLISAIKGSGEEKTFQISNNHGHVNGWVSRNQIFGKLTQVDP